MVPTYDHGEVVEMASTYDRDDEMVEYLERDQLVADRSRPVPRAKLRRRATAGLWALRVFAVVMSILVVYTFVAQLGH